MDYRCMLQGTGFAVTFTMTHVSKNYLDVKVEFAVDPAIQQITIRSVTNFVTVNELKRLLTYFDEHLSHIEEDSYVFMPQEVGFQLQAQMGDQGQDGTGYISLLVLLNIGFNKNGDRIYSGGKITVLLTELDLFLQRLQTTLDAIQYVQATMSDPDEAEISE